jgi:hypothetical protein
MSHTYDRVGAAWSRLARLERAVAEAASEARAARDDVHWRAAVAERDAWQEAADEAAERVVAETEARVWGAIA